MSEMLKVYVENLKGLSSEALDSFAQELVLDEKKNTACIIANITEIKERKYHLRLGYKNLFEYCTKHLNLSGGSVYLRTQVSAVCRLYPQLLEALHSGRLHLTGASLIAPYLKDDNVKSLIGNAEGKTKQKIKKMLAELAPKEPFKPSFRKQPSCKKKVGATQVGEKKQEVLTQETQTIGNLVPETNKSNGNPFSSSEDHRTRDILESATEDRYNFRFNAGEEFFEDFNRLAEVLGVEYAQKHMEKIFSQALKIALEKKDPKRKLARRRKREERASKKSSPDENKKLEPTQPEKNKKSESQNAEKPSETSGATRYISSEVRERVFERADYRCEYRGPDGRHCSARTNLQIEHTRPFSVYKNNDEKLLCVYCDAHNRFAAEEFFGSEFIEQKIEERRQKKTDRSEVEKNHWKDLTVFST